MADQERPDAATLRPVREAERAHRAVVRAGASAARRLGEAWGFDLDGPIGRSNARGSRTALRLGPDEWLVLDEGDPIGEVESSIEEACSIVDVSERNVAFVLEGACAADVVERGCPRDLSLAAFPVGACCRTVLGKAEIVIMRTAEQSFRIECWRSFSPYVAEFLKEAARDQRQGSIAA